MAQGLQHAVGDSVQEQDPAVTHRRGTDPKITGTTKAILTSFSACTRILICFCLYKYTWMSSENWVAKSSFTFYIYLPMVCIWGGIGMPPHAWGVQRKALGNWFSPSTVLVPRTSLGPWDLVANAFTWLSPFPGSALSDALKYLGY